MRTIHFILFIFIALYAGNSFADHLTVRNGYIPEGPPVARVLAGFMEFDNRSTDTVYIDSVSSPCFGAIEMHLSKEVDGVARMFPQAQLVIEPQSTLVLRPGSYHLMMFNPTRKLKDGDPCVLTFTLGNGHSFDYTITVRKMN